MGGMTLARLLQKHGASVRVYEKAPHLDTQNYAVELTAESGLFALEEAGLIPDDDQDTQFASSLKIDSSDSIKVGEDEIAETKSGKFVIMDSQGNVLNSESLAEEDAEEEEDAEVEEAEEVSKPSQLQASASAKRAEAEAQQTEEEAEEAEEEEDPEEMLEEESVDFHSTGLHRVLFESLKPNTVIWGCGVKALQPNGSGWTMELDDGTFTSTDLVIAADGFGSKLRPYITPVQPIFAGLSSVKGVIHNASDAVPRIHQMLEEAQGTLCIVQDSLSLTIGAADNDTIEFIAAQRSDDNWVSVHTPQFQKAETALEWFKSTHKGWAETWDDLFTHAEMPLTPKTSFVTPGEHSWTSQKNITFLGDAAHVTPTTNTVVDGVDWAMGDAVELFERLNQEASIPEAIAAYEKNMMERAAEIIKFELYAAQMMHSPDAVTFLKQGMDPQRDTHSDAAAKKEMDDLQLPEDALAEPKK